MKKLYAIEPDYCISKPEIITNCYQDLVLPEYFYIQLNYLKNGVFGNATESAIQILNQLNPHPESELLLFNNSYNGTIYFINQEIYQQNIYEKYQNNLTRENPLERYLLSLVILGEILPAKISFITTSSEIMRKLYDLEFEIGNIEELLSNNPSWLTAEMLREIPDKIDPLTQIKWEEEIIEISEQENIIEWFDIHN